jgi:hypothetical protein
MGMEGLMTPWRKKRGELDRKLEWPLEGRYLKKVELIAEHPGTGGSEAAQKIVS